MSRALDLQVCLLSAEPQEKHTGPTKLSFQLRLRGCQSNLESCASLPNNAGAPWVQAHGFVEYTSLAAAATKR